MKDSGGGAPDESPIITHRRQIAGEQEPRPPPGIGPSETATIILQFTPLSFQTLILPAGILTSVLITDHTPFTLVASFVSRPFPTLNH